jgi:ABC-type polysaccharide/polyol phosphate export permease
MYASIELFRFPLTGEPFNMIYFVESRGAGVLQLIFGVRYFKKTQDFFADFA